MELFSESYEKIINGKPVTCSVSKKEIEPAMHPEALIMDVSLQIILSWGCTLSYTIQFFCVPALESVRKISKKPVKIYAWMSGQASFMIYPFAPKHFGGRGDLRPQVMEQIAKGKSFEDASYEVGHN